MIAFVNGDRVRHTTLKTFGTVKPNGDLPFQPGQIKVEWDGRAGHQNVYAFVLEKVES